jgi:sensor histidine kinase regulating citrate/malate metabolism
MASSMLHGSAVLEDVDSEALRTTFALQGAILQAAVDAIIAIDDKGLIHCLIAALRHYLVTVPARL